MYLYGLTKTEFNNIRSYIWHLQDSKCWFCGVRVNKKHMTLEHIIPRSKGGGNDLANLAIVHKACNQVLGNMDKEEKLKMRKRFVCR